jgi:DNA polymerase III delta prime subunit
MNFVDALADFHQNFHTVYYPIVPCPAIDAFSGDLVECPNLLFYGSAGSLKREYLYTFIAKMFGLTEPLHQAFRRKNHLEKITVNNNKVEIPLAITDYFIEYDVATQLAYDRQAITEVIVPIITNRCLAHSRHVIILHNIDCMSKLAQLSLRRIVEQYHKTTLFLFTSTSMSRVQESIQSRLFAIRCPMLIHGNYQKELLKLYFERHGYEEDPQIIDVLVEQSRGDIVTSIIMLSTLEITEDIDKIVPVHQRDLTKLMDVLTETSKEDPGIRIWNLIDFIRAFSYKYLHFNVPLRDTASLILDYIKNKNKIQKKKKISTDSIRQIVSAITEADIALLTCGNKPYFVYERMFLKIHSAFMA